MKLCYVMCIVFVYFTIYFIVHVFLENLTSLEDYEKALVALLWPISLPFWGCIGFIMDIFLICDTLIHNLKEKRINKQNKTYNVH